MMDETILQEEVVNETQTNEESTPQVQQAQTPQTTKSELEARNIAALREKAFKAERERDEALRYVREMEAKKQQPIDEDFDVSLGDDEIAEGKHLSKVQKKIKAIESQLKKYQQESAMTAVESRIRSNYPDFDSVVSKDNLTSLQNSYPELAQTLLTSTDQYSQAASAYTLIKKLGIDNQGSYEMDKQRVQQNANKPKPLASIASQQGQGALSQANAFANGLTKDLKDQLIKEMQESRKGF